MTNDFLDYLIDSEWIYIVYYAPGLMVQPTQKSTGGTH